MGSGAGTDGVLKKKKHINRCQMDLPKGPLGEKEHALPWTTLFFSVLKQDTFENYQCCLLYAVSLSSINSYWDIHLGIKRNFPHFRCHLCLNPIFTLKQNSSKRPNILHCFLLNVCILLSTTWSKLHSRSSLTSRCSLNPKAFAMFFVFWNLWLWSQLSSF